MAAQIDSGHLKTEVQAAEYLGFRPATLRRWRCTQAQNLPYYKLGGSIRYRIADLDKWLVRRRVK